MVRFLKSFLVCAAAALLLSGVSQAAMVLTLDDLATPGIDVIMVDEVSPINPPTVSTGKGDATTVDGALGTAGVITYSGAVGGFTVNVATGVSKPNLGPMPQLHLNSVNVSGGAGTLHIELTDTGFVAPGGSVELRSWIGGTTTGTVSYEQILDPDNAEFALPADGNDVVISGGPLGSGAFAEEKLAALGVLAGPFSLTENVTIVHTGSGITSLDIDSSVIPEPASIAIWTMFGLVAACIGIKKGAVKRG